ncbi:MAG TPA: hypothetical protein VE965_04565, partial [Gammaproteobacteria bacterium]|nr:hypothetical protein [Gammaproteobacteria bacterium]
MRGQTFRQAEETHIDDEDSKDRYAAQDVNGLDAGLAANWPDHWRRCDSLGCWHSLESWGLPWKR